MLPILTEPRKSEPQSVSQSNTINSTNTATSSTNTIENNTEGIEVAGEDDIFGITKNLSYKDWGQRMVFEYERSKE